MKDATKKATTWVVWFVGMRSDQFPGNALRARTLDELWLSAGIGRYKDLLMQLFEAGVEITQLQSVVEHVWLDEECPADIQKTVAVARCAVGLMADGDRLVCVNAALCPADTEAFVADLAKGLATPLNVTYARSAVDGSSGGISLVFVSNTALDAGGLRGDAQLLRVECATGGFHDWFQSDEAVLIFNTQLTARHFNSISRGRSGYFVKRSAQKAKMRAEHEYLDNLPAVVRPFFPQCGDYHETTDGAFYEVEKIPFLDVSKLLVNGYFAQPQNAAELMRQVKLYLEAKPKKMVDPSVVQAQLSALFVDKTKKRLEQLEASSQYSGLNVIAQQQAGCSLADVGETYVAKLAGVIARQKSDQLELAHGDLFFGNMLYDPTTQRLKLIDPRGGTGDKALMPVVYDMAKLSHSVMGLYDLMVYDLLNVELRDDLTYGLVPKNCQALGLSSLRQAFSRLTDELRLDLKELRLFEGALFLSMLPLHSDSPKRQACQLLRAIELLKNFENR